jgi:hypothetical protein
MISYSRYPYVLEVVGHNSCVPVTSPRSNIVVYCLGLFG